MEFENLNRALKEYGERATQLAKLELGTYKPRISRSSTWQGMNPTSTKISFKKRRAVASGRLQKSIEYKIKPIEDAAPLVEFLFEKYGKFVEEGRQAGKGVPPAEIKRWITEDRKMRYFNREKRQFEKMTEAKLNAMSFMINRSIKAYGIQANPFMMPAESRAMSEHFENITNAYSEDLLDDLTEE